MRTRLFVPTLIAGTVSLAVTIAHVAGVLRPWPGADVLGMAESVTLMAAAGLVVRYSPLRQAAVAAPVAGLASATWLLRVFTPESPLAGLGAAAFWGLGAMLATAVGGYLRSLEVRQERAIADTQTALRLRLARDLHDFVAHDLGEMVAHAQAGQVAGDPARALERVEAAGQRALSMLDRTLDMLHHDRPMTPVGDLGGIAEAAERFSAAGPAQVNLRINPEIVVGPDTAALAYRIVIEGLTNVRRHAPRARSVELDVTISAGTLEVTLVNDGVTRSQKSRRGSVAARHPDVSERASGPKTPMAERGSRIGGSGLPGLSALVAEHGGELMAAAVPDGWSLTARLPLAQSPA
ncbi:sensor histidine kinase [Nonomuraea longicatena]|uniref:histidine kinase n=1 Tax=Nonomuraea longicatena TaxID=83682 RepID=A0ABN1PBS2_9ACTN